MRRTELQPRYAMMDKELKYDENTQIQPILY